MRVQLLLSSVVLVVIVAIVLNSVVVSAATATCGSTTGCGLRAYLCDLQTEYDKLTVLNVKLNKTIDLYISTNSTLLASQIKTRSAQLKKIQDAQYSLSLELSIVSDKCSKYDGDNCDKPICFGILPSNSSICSGHGKCIATDTCQCDSGWASSNCGVFTCNGVLANNATVCGGRGQFTGTWCNSVTITADVNGVRKYTDGTYARSCKDYISPTSSVYLYSGNTGSGYYWIKPDATALKVYCQMVANGGGLTGLTTEVEASSLNTGSQSRNYFYLKDNNAWYKSPTMTLVWNTGTNQKVGGTYFYTTNNGATLNSFGCGTAEAGYGIGCSDGNGANNKIFVQYRMGEHLARLCQDYPAAFGSPGCQDNLGIYIL